MQEAPPFKGKGKCKEVAINAQGLADRVRAQAPVAGSTPFKGKGKCKEVAVNAQGLADRVRAQAPVAGSPSFAPLPGRADFPTVLPCKRANQDSVLAAGASDEGKSRMLAAFDKDILAASSRTTGCALWNTWCTFHSVWFSDDVPALPLDAEKIRKTAASFKEGSHKAYRSYR